jgi:hypothetical protein
MVCGLMRGSYNSRNIIVGSSYVMVFMIKCAMTCVSRYTSKVKSWYLFDMIIIVIAKESFFVASLAQWIFW